MKKKSLLLYFVTVFYTSFSFAQYATVYPTNWWVGMKRNKVQLLIRSSGDAFNTQQVRINYPGVKLNKVSKFENGKYLAVDITVAATAKPGTLKIQFVNGSKTNSVQWELKARRKGNGTAYAQGITSADFIYLLMPDRFRDRKSVV